MAENTSYQPQKRNVWQNLGRALSGASAPFLGDFEWAQRQAQIDAANQRADMEFQQFLMKNEIDTKELAIKERSSQFERAMYDNYLKNNPDFAETMGVSPNQPTGVTTPSLGGKLPLSVVGVSGGKPKFGYDPLVKDAMKDAMSASKSLTSTDRFIRRYSDSYNEVVKKFPDIGKAGIEGKMSRIQGILSEKLDELPKTSAFVRKLKVSANQMARDIEGGRVTDQDRQVYADSMVNALTAPSETNVILASESLIDLRERGGDITPTIRKFLDSGNPLLISIADEVLREVE